MNLDLRVIAGLTISCAGAIGGCGSSGPSGPSQLAIVPASGSSLDAVAGDALGLKVVEKAPDGSTTDLPSGATVVWSAPTTVTALAPESTDPSPLPAFGAQPTALWIDNPNRPDRDSDLTGVLFILDAGAAGGAVQVSATVSGTSNDGAVSATVSVGPGPTGDATRGETIFMANCSTCHRRASTSFGSR